MSQISKLGGVIEKCYGDVFDAEEVVQQFDGMMKRIIDRERNWDIKVSTYILENYKSKKLFLDAFHPSNDVLRMIAKEILSLLEIKIEEAELNCDFCLDTHEEPVYPATKRILNLEWVDSEIRRSKRAKKAVEHMDFDEYVREYIWWCGQGTGENN